MSGPIYGGALLSSDECQDVIVQLRGSLRPSRVGNDGDQRLRISQQQYFTDPPLLMRIAAEMTGYAHERGIAVDGGFEQLCVIKYDVGGMYDWHMDNELVAPGQARKVALVLALNDEYEGGGTEFMWPHPGSTFTAKPAAGSGVMFPSIILHRALPVTAGERWVLVTWAMGPQWT